MAGKFEFCKQSSICLFNYEIRCKKHWFIGTSDYPWRYHVFLPTTKMDFFCSYLRACSSSLKFLVMSRVLKLKTRFSLLIHDAELCCRWKSLIEEPLASFRVILITNSISPPALISSPVNPKFQSYIDWAFSVYYY